MIPEGPQQRALGMGRVQSESHVKDAGGVVGVLCKGTCFSALDPGPRTSGLAIGVRTAPGLSFWGENCPLKGGFYVLQVIYEHGTQF